MSTSLLDPQAEIQALRREIDSLQHRLAQQALHDRLTGLPNRTLLLDRLARARERIRRREEYRFAVVFLNLNRFKKVNDSLGLSQGDQILAQVANRLTASVRSLDTVARYGGDEFVILLEEFGSVSEVMAIVRRVHHDLSAPFAVAGREILLTASSGLVLTPGLGESPEDLLRDAILAMHKSREEGPGGFKVFHTRMRDEASKLMDMEADLRRALEQDEFFIEYQPVVSLKDSTVTGFEALLRWRHPSWGVIPPADFLPLADDVGLMAPIGEWVLNQACADMASWLAGASESGRAVLSVNISARQFLHAALPEQVTAALQKSGLAPERLRLEITEAVLMESPDTALTNLERLREMDVRVSIDDFGTGYSSLTLLQRLPVDTIKVDRSFISGLAATADQGDARVVRAVIGLAQSLGLDVIAEGVEDREQLALLTDLNCGQGQGFLFSRPLDPGLARELMAPNVGLAPL